jgi:DNA-binding winged helix-turn-helix (wHTH) protein
VLCLHSSSALAPRDFTVGDWLVQPSLNRMCRDSSIVRLRPQLVDVLVCLAERAGTTVAKDEMLQAVWPGQYIVESGLARCVAELRQALGDTARQGSRYIETIPRRGYRLIPPVTVLPEPATLDSTWNPSTPAALRPDDRADVLEQTTGAAVPAAAAGATDLVERGGVPLAARALRWWRRQGANTGQSLVRTAVGAITSWAAWR